MDVELAKFRDVDCFERVSVLLRALPTLPYEWLALKSSTRPPSAFMTQLAQLNNEEWWREVFGDKAILGKFVENSASEDLSCSGSTEWLGDSLSTCATATESLLSWHGHCLIRQTPVPRLPPHHVHRVPLSPTSVRLCNRDSRKRSGKRSLSVVEPKLGDGSACDLIGRKLIAG